MYVIAARTVVHYERSFVISYIRPAFTTSGYYFSAGLRFRLRSLKFRLEGSCNRPNCSGERHTFSPSFDNKTHSNIRGSKSIATDK